MKWSEEDRQLQKQIQSMDLSNLASNLEKVASPGESDGSDQWVAKDDDLASMSDAEIANLARNPAGFEGRSLFHVDLDEAVGRSAHALGTDKMASVLQQASVIKAAEGVQFMQHSRKGKQGKQNELMERIGNGLSENQVAALKKYPALIEVLGSSDGDKLVKEIVCKVNELMVEKIGANSQAASKFAKSCQVDRQNIKQFFVGENEDWVCCVTASGPFRGDEAIYYDPDKDKSAILRIVKDDFANVTGEFNVIHEFAKKD